MTLDFFSLLFGIEMEEEIKNAVWHRSGVSNVRSLVSVAPYCDLISMKIPAKTEDFTCGLSILRSKLYKNITILIFVVPCIMLNSEINPTRCNNCVFILRNGFTLHVSGDNSTHHQEYICCIWPFR